jgi:Caspase domain
VAETREALIVASSQFSDPKFAELRAPIHDVSALTRVLEDPKIGGFNVRTLVNEATPVVQEELEGFFSDRKRDDFLLLYFSCHGIKDVSGRLYFVCTNTRFDRLRATGISSVFVEEQIAHSISKKIVVLLDCCFSGAFTRGMTARASDTVDVTDQLGGRGRVIITASGATEYAFEGGELTARNEAQPSIFTSAVVDALGSGKADQDADAWISVDELYDYVYDSVRDQTPDQTPGKVTNVEGTLFVARSVRVAPLPPSLQELLASDRIDERIGAAGWLGTLLGAQDPPMVLAARQALTRLSEDDDSVRVRAEARRLLERDEPAGAAPPEPPPEEPQRRQQIAVSQSRPREPGTKARAGRRRDTGQRPTPVVPSGSNPSAEAVRSAPRGHPKSESSFRTQLVKELKRLGWGLGEPYLNEASPNVYYADEPPHKKPRVVIRGARVRIERRTTGGYQIWKSFSLEREMDAALEAVRRLGRTYPRHYYHGEPPEVTLLTAQLKRLGYRLEPSAKHVYRDSAEKPPWPTRIVVRDTQVDIERLNDNTSKYELQASFSLEYELPAALDAVKHLKRV